ncbi:MAG: hypothetical protein AAGE52_24175 [Myxococcota bacterium]
MERRTVVAVGGALGLLFAMRVVVGKLGLEWATAGALGVASLLLVATGRARSSLAGAFVGLGLYAAVVGSGFSGPAIGFAVLLSPLAAYLGALLVRRSEVSRWGATGVAAVLCLSLVVIGSYVAIVRLVATPGSLGSQWAAVTLAGWCLAALSLGASVLPWLALRRVTAARGGRVHELGRLVLVDGTIGRANTEEVGEVIAWPANFRAERGGYREGAGPPWYEVFFGDRAQYVDWMRRRAMRVHLVGLALLWLVGGPLIGGRLGGFW